MSSDTPGHASFTTTMDTYAHLLPTMDRDAAAEFAAALRDAERRTCTTSSSASCRC